MFSLCAQRDLKCSSPVAGSWRGGGGGGLLERLKLPHANVEEVEPQQQRWLVGWLVRSRVQSSFPTCDCSGCEKSIFSNNLGAARLSR